MTLWKVYIITTLSTLYLCAPVFSNISSASDCSIIAKLILKKAPFIISESRQSKIDKLFKSDLRLGTLELAKYSSSLDALLDLTNPTSLREFVFSGRAKPKFFRATAAKSLLENIKLDDFFKTALEEAERNFDIATGLIASSYKLAHGGVVPKEWSEEFFKLKSEFLEKINADIQAAKGIPFKKLFISEPQKESAFPVYEIYSPESSSLFSQGFSNAVNGESNLITALSSAINHSRKFLDNMPAGISLKPVETVNTVRLGGNHYYGNYYQYKAISRAAYTRKGSGILGVTNLGIKAFKGTLDAELNLTRHQKRLIGVLIDQTHRSLDPFTPLSSKPFRCFHSCGSYPNFILLKAGFPLVSPGYIWPEASMTSLALQRLFRIPTVKKFTTERVSVGTVALGPIVAFFHGGRGTQLEWMLYGLMYASGKWVWVALTETDDNKQIIPAEDENKPEQEQEMEIP
jgi:hypothetical protein